MTTAGRAPWNKGVATGLEPANKGRIDPIARMRECNQCGGWLSFEAFGKAASKAHGIHSTCLNCCYVNRNAQEAELWSSFVAKLGGRCSRCTEDTPVCLQLVARSAEAKMAKVAAKVRERRPSTLARKLMADHPRAEILRRHWALICANCEIKSRPHGRMTLR